MDRANEYFDEICKKADQVGLFLKVVPIIIDGESCTDYQLCDTFTGTEVGLIHSSLQSVEVFLRDEMRRQSDPRLSHYYVELAGGTILRRLALNSQAALAEFNSLGLSVHEGATPLF